MPFEQQAAQRRRFSRSPVQGPLAAPHFGSLSQQAGDPRIGNDLLGRLAQFLEDRGELLGVHAGIRFSHLLIGAAIEACPVAGDLVADMDVVVALRRDKLFLQVLASLARDPLGLLGGDAALAQEVIAISLQHRLPLADRTVEQGLREAGLVGFVVASAAIPVHVDDDIALVRVPKVHGEADDLSGCLGILSVYVQDRDLQHPCDTRRVRCRACLARGSREADLVVDNDVNRAAHPVPGELAHVQGLLHDPFASECRVAVQQDA